MKDKSSLLDMPAMENNNAYPAFINISPPEQSQNEILISISSFPAQVILL